MRSKHYKFRRKLCVRRTIRGYRLVVSTLMSSASLLTQHASPTAFAEVAYVYISLRGLRRANHPFFY